jgi:hypothetical protein
VPKDRKPRDLTLLGRLGAYSQHAKYDVRETTKAARAARDQKFINEVDPEGTLDPAERDRRVAAARKAYFTRISLLSAEARRSRASTNGNASDGRGGS